MTGGVEGDDWFVAREAGGMVVSGGVVVSKAGGMVVSGGGVVSEASVVPREAMGVIIVVSGGIAVLTGLLGVTRRLAVGSFFFIGTYKRFNF